MPARATIVDREDDIAALREELRALAAAPLAPASLHGLHRRPAIDQEDRRVAAARLVTSGLVQLPVEWRAVVGRQRAEFRRHVPVAVGRIGMLVVQPVLDEPGKPLAGGVMQR